MKKFAVFNEQGQKIAGYLEDYPNIPADAIEITDEEESLYNNGYIRVNGVPTPAPPIEIPLDEIKQAKINELKAERDQLEVEPIEYNGHLFDFDEKSRDRISSAIIALEISGTAIEWTLADNTSAEVTANDLKAVIACVAMRSNALHVAYREAKEAVERAENKEEVEAITLH